MVSNLEIRGRERLLEQREWDIKGREGRLKVDQERLKVKEEKFSLKAEKLREATSTPTPNSAMASLSFLTPDQLQSIKTISSSRSAKHPSDSPLSREKILSTNDVSLNDKSGVNQGAESSIQTRKRKMGEVIDADNGCVRFNTSLESSSAEVKYVYASPLEFSTRLTHFGKSQEGKSLQSDC